MVRYHLGDLAIYGTSLMREDPQRRTGRADGKTDGDVMVYNTGYTFTSLVQAPHLLHMLGVIASLYNADHAQGLRTPQCVVQLAQGVTIRKTRAE